MSFVSDSDIRRNSYAMNCREKRRGRIKVRGCIDRIDLGITRFSQLVIPALCIVVSLQCPTVAQTDRWRAVTDLIDTLKTPSSLSSREREDKASQLATLIRCQKGQAAPQNVILDLAALMSDADPLVRAWTAGALGNLGPQAAAAITALEKAFAEAQAADPPNGFRSGIHLDDVIEQALKKIRRSKK